MWAPLTCIQSLKLVAMLSMRWSTNKESSNCLSSYKAVCNFVRVAGGWKHDYTACPKVSQRFSVGLRLGTWLHSMSKGILKIFSGIEIGWICWPLHMCNPLTLQLDFNEDSSMGMRIIIYWNKNRTSFVAYNLTVGSRTSSRYRAVIIEFRLKVCTSVWYMKSLPISWCFNLRIRQARWCSGVDCVFLLLSRSLHAWYLVAGRITTSVNIMLPESDTVQLICFWYHFNHAPLNWTDRGIQTRGTQAYSPFPCSLQCTVGTDIVLLTDATIIDVTLWFHLATTAKYRYIDHPRRL